MDLQWPFSMGILGSSTAGKTYCIKYLLRYYRNSYKFCVVISPTFFNGNYDFLQREGINHKMQAPVDLDRQITVLMKKQKYYKNRGEYMPLILVIDDCAGELRMSKKITNFISTARHYEISIIFVAQYAADLPPRLRELTYYGVIFDQNTQRSLKAVYESYFQHIGSFKEFMEYFKKELAHKHSFFFIDRLKKRTFVTKCP